MILGTVVDMRCGFHPDKQLHVPMHPLRGFSQILLMAGNLRSGVERGRLWVLEPVLSRFTNYSTQSIANANSKRLASVDLETATGCWLINKLKCWHTQKQNVDLIALKHRFHRAFNPSEWFSALRNPFLTRVRAGSLGGSQNRPSQSTTTEVVVSETKRCPPSTRRWFPHGPNHEASGHPLTLTRKYIYL